MSLPLEDPPGPDPVKEPPPTLSRWAVRGAALLIATRLVTQVFVWASTLLIARFLTPEDYGLMSIGLLLIGLADMFTEAGMSGALIHKKDLDAQDLKEAFTLNLLFALAMYGLLFVT